MPRIKMVALASSKKQEERGANEKRASKSVENDVVEVSKTQRRRNKSLPQNIIITKRRNCSTCNKNLLFIITYYSPPEVHSKP